MKGSDDGFVREYWWFYVEELASLGKSGLFQSPPTSPNLYTTQSSTDEDADRRVAKVLAEKGKWSPFGCLDRDRLEETHMAGKLEMAVSAHSGQRLWLANLERMEMTPMYWKGGSIVALRRAIWLVIPDEDSHEGIPCPVNWEAVFEPIIRDNWDWLDSRSELNNSLPLEKCVQLSGPLNGYSLQMKRGIRSMATLIPPIATPASLMKGILPASPPRPIKLLRGYPAYYGAVVTAINNPATITHPPPTSMTPEPKPLEIPPSPYDIIASIKPKPIKHVIFVVHGIGQKLADKVGYGFVASVNSLRRFVLSYSSTMNFDLEDVFILPIQWRADLDMGSGYFPQADGQSSGAVEFDSLMSAITLPSVPAIRTLATDVTMDILLYMTPRHFNRIVDACVKEIRRVHALFLKWNPDSISITKYSLIGHSLGSALVSDLIGIGLDRETVSPDALTLCTDGVTERLGFEVENFFSLGSPLSLFWLLKHIKPVACTRRDNLEESIARFETEVGVATESPPKLGFFACRQLFNLFMPYDPVAYRMEPLIVPPNERKDIINPVPVQYCKGGMTGLKIGVAESLTKTKQEMIDVVSRSLPQWFMERIGSPDMSAFTSPEAIPPTPTLCLKLLNSFNDNSRVDYCLQDSIMENSYLSSVSSHFSYWSDQDVANFLLTQLLKH